MSGCGVTCMVSHWGFTPLEAARAHCGLRWSVVSVSCGGECMHVCLLHTKPSRVRGQADTDGRCR